jgi:hypothetical protein
MSNARQTGMLFALALRERRDGLVDSLSRVAPADSLLFSQIPPARITFAPVLAQDSAARRDWSAMLKTYERRANRTLPPSVSNAPARGRRNARRDRECG